VIENHALSRGQSQHRHAADHADASSDASGAAHGRGQQVERQEVLP
jgi:hypothetical protein